MARVHLIETLEHHVKVVRPVTNDDVREMIGWCKQPEYPGAFGFHYGTLNNPSLVFEFTDADLAFQFKMRFG